jgi:hypothetical protein
MPQVPGLRSLLEYPAAPRAWALRGEPLFRLSGIARRLQTAAGMRTPSGSAHYADAFWSAAALRRF